MITGHGVDDAVEVHPAAVRANDRVVDQRSRDVVKCFGGLAGVATERALRAGGAEGGHLVERLLEACVLRDAMLGAANSSSPSPSSCTCLATSAKYPAAISATGESPFRLVTDTASTAFWERPSAVRGIRKHALCSPLLLTWV